MKILRSSVPIWLGVFGGSIVLLAMFIKIPVHVGLWSKWFLEWRVILASFALTLGAGNLLRIHANRIRMKREAWMYSYVTIVALIGYTVLGILFKRTHPVYSFIFDNAYSPLSATVFSINAFYISSACYRAFRARNGHAAVLLLSGVIVMLGSVGIGYAIWPGFNTMTQWIMNYPNSAAMRGMNIGAALGIIGVSLRVIFGLERGHLGGE
ncbi:MAG: hypothetical protein Q8P31_13715 [Bacillota bacterium]|nr:hypothetical protein [Bacillota bacterium]